MNFDFQKNFDCKTASSMRPHRHGIPVPEFSDRGRI